MNILTVLACMVFAICSIAILWGEKLLTRTRELVLATALCTVAFYIRLVFMDHTTLDYINFLSNWVEYFRQNGGFRALSGSVGNYNVPYLYFLALFSYLDIYDLYLIKLLSIIFDVLLAWGCLKLTGLYTAGTGKRMLVFLAALFLPTVVLNGSYWGQCDSIYVAFAVWSLYFALSGRPIWSVVFIALSFSFKLQAVFVMPVFLVLIFAGRVKWWHLAFFPLTYLIVVTPAVLAGKPFIETLTLYISQGDTVGSGLNYNSSSIFALFSNVADKTGAARLGIGAAFTLVFLVFYWTYVHRDRLSKQVILLCTLLFAVGIPYFLPHMHDRYFFAADIFSLVTAVVLPKYFPLPVLVSFASYLGYHAYLKGRFLLPLRYGAIALAISLILILIAMASRLYGRKKAGEVF